MILKLKPKRKKTSVQKLTNSKLETNDLNLACTAANAAEEKKGENILLLDVSKLTIVTDYFVILTAKSMPQIQAIANHIEEKLSSLNYRLNSKEGLSNSNWVILDFGSLIVHIMSEKERNYYKLERFWSNATFIDNKKWKKWEKAS